MDGDDAIIIFAGLIGQGCLGEAYNIAKKKVYEKSDTLTD